MESRTHEFASALFASVNIHLHCVDDLVVVGEVFVVSHAETVWTGNVGVNGQTWPKSVANVGEVRIGHAEGLQNNLEELFSCASRMYLDS